MHQRPVRGALRRAADLQLPPHRRRRLRPARRAGATRCSQCLDRFDARSDEFDRLITCNEIFVKRLADVAVITREQAIDYGLSARTCAAAASTGTCGATCRTGPTPSSSSRSPVGRGWTGEVGDCFDRYYVRVLEMAQSSRIVRQALEKMPEGEVQAKVPRKIKPEAGEVLVAASSRPAARWATTWSPTAPRAPTASGPHRLLHRDGNHRGHLSRPDGRRPRRPHRFPRRGGPETDR